MGFHGMGQAFNLQYQRRGNVNIHRGVPQYCNNQSIFPQYQMPAFQQSTQIEIQNGPGGFWGFMQGFTEQGGFQGLFDCLGKIFGGGGKTSEETTTPTSPGADDGWGAAGPGDLTDGANIRVHDDVKPGGGTDINGQSKVSSDKSDDGYPKTITVKGYRYEYQETKDGVALYKSLDGKGDVYRLEKNTDGSFGLNQYQGDKGAGSIDIGRRVGNAGGASGNTSTGKIKVPFNWGKVNQTGQNLLAAGLSSGKIKTAADLAKWLKSMQPGATVFQNDLIKNNPSVFTPDGKVKPNADFSRLDIPNGFSVMIPNET